MFVPGSGFGGFPINVLPIEGRILKNTTVAVPPVTANINYDKFVVGINYSKNNGTIIFVTEII
jgi:hypothetical protein